MQGRLKKMEDNIESIFSFFKELGLETSVSTAFDRSNLRARRLSKKGTLAMKKVGTFIMDLDQEAEKRDLPVNPNLASHMSSPVNPAAKAAAGSPQIFDEIKDSGEIKMAESIKISTGGTPKSKPPNKRGGSLRSGSIFGFIMKAMGESKAESKE